MALRSLSGTSRRSARCSTISREGVERPLSMKLRCFCETSASTARSSWLKWRSSRHDLTNSPTAAVDLLLSRSYASASPESITSHVIYAREEFEAITWHVIALSHNRAQNRNDRNQSRFRRPFHGPQNKSPSSCQDCCARRCNPGRGTSVGGTVSTGGFSGRPH